MKIKVLDLNFQNNSHSIAAFLVQGNGSPVLVECGPHSTLHELEKTLAAEGLSLSEIRHLFISHIHFDHAGAAWALAKNGTQIFVHPKGLPHLAQPEKLYNSAKQIYQSEMDRLWGRMEPIAPERLYPPAHGEVIEVEGLRLRAWHTPGHAVHHIVWEVGEAKRNATSVLFAGDVAGVKIGRRGPVVPPCPPPDIDVEAWLESIELIRNLPVETLFLTHFGKVTNKNEHLAALAARLNDWANWMRPYFENGTPQAEIVPKFEKYVLDSLRREGVRGAARMRYEAANPAFMSVAGLMRYWFKKLQA